MARFIHIEYPVQHGGVTRVSRAASALGNLSLVAALAAIGRPFTRAFAGWNAARKQRREDEKLWAVALSDARVMADLSRAMSQDALRDTRGYY